MKDMTYSYVALLDVLGYREYLERDRTTGQFEFKEAMRRALSIFTTVNQVEFGYTAISDTIIVTCSSREKVVDFLRLLKRIQVSFLKEGMFLRGAAVYAQHFQSGNLTYSHALARAYEIEQEAAIYPRIMLDRNIIEMFATTEKETGLLSSGLVAEWNGAFFVNILDSRNWLAVYSAASEMFERDSAKLVGHESAFAKHVWFENYLFSIRKTKQKVLRYIPKPLVKGVKSHSSSGLKSVGRFTFDREIEKARTRLSNVYDRVDEAVHEGTVLHQAGLSPYILSLWIRKGWIIRQSDGYLRLTKRGFKAMPNG